MNQKKNCYLMQYSNDNRLFRKSNPVGDSKRELIVPLLLVMMLLFEKKFENKYEVINRL